MGGCPVRLAIIGTAGRGTDGARLPALWPLMSSVAQSVVTVLRADELVSGGAAGGDSLAVRLFNAGYVKALTLHLPAPFVSTGVDTGQFAETTRADCGTIANRYHRLFTEGVSFNSLHDLTTAIAGGAKVVVTPGFKERNTLVARDADALLAFTFGSRGKVADGGTLDTVTKHLARRKALEDKGELHGLRAYHFDLNSKLLYRL